MDTLAQGTQAWIVEKNGTITGDVCLFDIDEIKNNVNEVETTTLCETEAKRYEYGIADSEINATLKFNSDDPAVQKILSLYHNQKECYFVIGISDGTGAPSWDGTQIQYPNTRSFISFTFKIREVPVSIEKQGLVTMQIPLRLTSKNILIVPFNGSWMRGRGFSGFWKGNIAWQT